MNTKFVSYFLALIFFASGFAKLFSLQFEIAAFTRWGYPLFFMYLVGVIEVMGGIGILLSRLSAITAVCLALFMLGAIATHLIYQEWVMLLVALTIFLIAAFRGWVGRSDIVALFKPIWAKD